jgi:Ca2+-binding EF-hand superfamily protein
MKSNRYQMIFVFMPIFFFVMGIFMTPNISEGKQSYLFKHDKDNDGKLSKDEFPGSDKAFNNLDKNQDGYIDKDEAHKPRKDWSKKGKRGYIDAHDKDNDGKLSKDEFPGSDKTFDNLDKNQDGFIDKDEAHKARKDRLEKEKNKQSD